MSENKSNGITERNVQSGDWVRYIGCSDDQLTYNGTADDPRPVLGEDEVYKVESVESHPWYTLVKLVAIDGWFPSVCFYQARTVEVASNRYVAKYEVEVTPMTRAEYNVYRGWELPANENGDDAGYLVRRKNPTDSSVFHVAWEPVDIFERSYCVLTDAFNFSDALRFLKQGARVARKGWSGVGLHVRWEGGTRLADGTLLEGHFVIVSASGVVNTWVPSVSDLQATDWLMAE